ncbi:MAG: SDR family NAD(P)-dependent oxidoreductase [Propionibacteriaceae bacterium]|jgi:NAD(P)-dependent dehydrogenase (short-subunit alcohol dehydrogenase family)|nr:SDR family NAD(P)-dependent oxidoreductase [Propionibacteriaceae bacterium]
MPTTSRSDLYSQRFVGKTAVVTGAGSGIGLATAEMIIEDGGQVVAVDLVRERLADAQARLGSSYIPHPIDITVPGAADEVVTHAGRPIDILVNNAGIMDGFLPAAEVDDATWDRVLAVNTTAMMRFCRAAIPLMIRQGHGAIVNVSSEASLRICAGIAYTASKHAVNGITKHIAAIYASAGIRCNAVAPGSVRTNVGGAFKSEVAAHRLNPIMAATVPEAAEPELLARAICFLADDYGAKHINGVILPVDAGWSVV